jgi:hypothetical protein
VVKAAAVLEGITDIVVTEEAGEFGSRGGGGKQADSCPKDPVEPFVIVKFEFCEFRVDVCNFCCGDDSINIRGGV